MNLFACRNATRLADSCCCGRAAAATENEFPEKTAMPKSGRWSGLQVVHPDTPSFVRLFSVSSRHPLFRKSCIHFPSFIMAEVYPASEANSAQ
jgi:hypothetical protein